MKSCKWVKHHLSAFVAEEMAPEEASHLQNHLADCPQCRFELKLTKRIQGEALALRIEGEDALATVNWDALETRIVAADRFRRENRPAPRLSGLLQGALAACVMVPILMVMLYTVPGPVAAPEIRLSGMAFQQMETNVARKEVRRVLSGSRLLLSEFMEQCPGQNDGPFSWQSDQDVRKLMARNRMLRKDLDRARLQNARGLCRKLDMVFSEMVSVSRTDGCRDVTRLQKLLRREHIFLKIRLVEEELKQSGGEA